MSFWNAGRTWSGVDVSVAERLTGFPVMAAEPAGLYQSRDWLRSVEQMSPELTRYVIAASGGTVLGVLPVYLLPPHRAGYYHPEQAFGIGGEFTGPVAVAGGRAGYLTGWAVPGDRATRAGVLTALLRSAEAIADEAGAGALTVQYLPAQEAAVLADTGLVDPAEVLMHAAAAVIELPGDSFADYVAALSTSRRSTVRNDLNRFGRAGLAIRTGRLSEAMEFAPRLVAALSGRHGGSSDAAKMRSVLLAQSAFLDASSVVIAAARPGGEPVAFSLSYVYDSTLYVRFAGFEEADARASAAYFVTTYYETVRYAYRHGIRLVDFGVAPYRPKIIRGARLEPLYGVLRRPSRTAMRPGERADVADWLAAALRDDLGSFAAAMTGLASTPGWLMIRHCAQAAERGAR